MGINIGEILENSFKSYFYPVIAPIIKSLIIGFVFVIVGWVISLATGSKAIFTFGQAATMMKATEEAKSQIVTVRASDFDWERSTKM